MQKVSPYNQVIFKEGEGDNNEDLVNSYRFKSASPVKHKKWSPDISRDERYKKKRLREDEYVKTLNQEEKPILLIKNKNLYQNVKSPYFSQNPDTHNEFYKVSKNTEVIEDIKEQIKLNEELVRKKTLIYRPKDEEEEPDQPITLKNIYKINGIEFLPEGFLELEPLLLMDEYKFDTKVHEELFIEEQKKIKVQRRKQYEQKEFQKQREVTIFVVDQYKDKLVEYLDQWYATNKRKMTPDELEYISKVLKTEPEDMARLQNLYLHRKKVLNGQKLHGYLYPEGKIQDERFDLLSEDLKKLFTTRPRDAYADVGPRVFKDNGQYQPKYLQKNKKKGQNFQKLNSTQGIKSQADPLNTGKPNDMKYAEFSDNFENIISGNARAQNQNTQSVNPNLAYTTGRVRKTFQYDSNLKTYFDTEINTILDRIKGLVPYERKPQKVPQEQGSQKFVSQYKEKLGDLMRTPVSSDVIRMDSQLKKYNENPMEYKPYAKTDLLNNPDDFQIKGKNKKSNVNAIPENKSERATSKKETLLNKISEADKKVPNNKSSLSQDQKAYDETSLPNDVTVPLRVTIVSRNDQGASIVSQKLRPSLVNNEYFFQVIDDVIEPNGSRSATLITRNYKGQIIAEQALDIEDIGNFYQNFIVVEPKEGRVSILVRNEKGQTISVTPIKTQSQATGEKVEIVLQKNGNRRSTITKKSFEGELRRYHQIRPTLIGSEYYNQTVEEVFEGNSKKRLTVTTLNENGDVVSISRANPNLMADNYYTEIVMDAIDNNAQRKIVMSTFNNRGESVIRQTFTTSLAGILTEQLYTEMLEEVEDELGKRKITVASKNARGHTEVSQQVRPSFVGDNYYIEIVSDAVDKLGKRKVTLCAKNLKGETIIEKQYEPDLNEIIGEKYYEDITQELKKELETAKQTKNSTQIRPENQDYSLEVSELITSDRITQVKAIARSTTGAILIEKTYIMDEGATLGDEHYDSMINDIEDELANRRNSSVVRRTTARSRNQTTKLSQISETEEKRSASNTSYSRISQKAERVHERQLESAMINHEKQILNQNSQSVSVPRVTRVRDSYYRDLLNQLGFNKKNYNPNHRTTQQYSPSRPENERHKAYTMNPAYQEKDRASGSGYRSPAKILEEVRSRKFTPDQRSKSPILNAIDPEKNQQTDGKHQRPKNFTVKTPTRNTLAVKIDERPKVMSEALSGTKNPISSKKVLQQKDSIASKQTLNDRPSSGIETVTKKHSANSTTQSQAQKKTLTEKLIKEDRQSHGKSQKSDANVFKEEYKEEEKRPTKKSEVRESALKESNRQSTDAKESKHRDTNSSNEPLRKSTKSGSQKHRESSQEPKRKSTAVQFSKQSEPELQRKSTEVKQPQHRESSQDPKRKSTETQPRESVQESKRKTTEVQQPKHRESTQDSKHKNTEIKPRESLQEPIRKSTESKLRESLQEPLRKSTDVQKLINRDSIEPNKRKSSDINQPVHHGTTVAYGEILGKGRDTNYSNITTITPPAKKVIQDEPKKRSSILEQRRSRSVSQPDSIRKSTGAIVDRKIKEEIDKLMDDYRRQTNDKVIKKIEDDIINRRDSNVLGEFYAFCEKELPGDIQFKESMLLVSLFYYFLEKKDLVN